MSLFVSCFYSSFHFGVSFPEGFSRFTLTLRFRFLSLFVTDSVSYLHNNALIRKATNRSVSGGSTPTAENRCQCLTWVLSKKQKQEKNKTTHVLQHHSAVSHVAAFSLFSALEGKPECPVQCIDAVFREQVHTVTFLGLISLSRINKF